MWKDFMVWTTEWKSFQELTLHIMKIFPKFKTLDKALSSQTSSEVFYFQNLMHVATLQKSSFLSE